MRDDGFDGLQIFASSPRTWRTPAKDGESFHDRGQMAQTRNLGLFVHAIYLLNIASADETMYEASIRSLRWTMDAAHDLGALAVIAHMGSHGGQGFGTARSRIERALSRVLSDVPSSPALLLENSAGGGGYIGTEWQEVGGVVKDLGGHPGLGICLDTAHAFATGNDIRSPGGVDEMLAQIDAHIGLDHLRLVHLNDSKTDLNGRRDRHENIGAGQITEAGFANLLGRPEIAALPLMLETPNLERRKAELRLLRGLHPDTQALVA